MTKSKRFVMKDPNDWGHPITDTDTCKVYSCASNIWMKELCTDINKIVDENEQLKQFPIKLDNRIQKLEEDLKALKEMETDDLNPQAIEDVAIVIEMSLNALKEFKKELKGDVE